MKKLNRFILAFCVLSMFAACRPDFDGTGEVVTDVRNVNSFSALDVRGHSDVQIVNDSRSFIEVIGYANIIQTLTSRVSGATLIIDHAGGYVANDNIRVVVHVPYFNSVALNGSANVIGDDYTDFGPTLTVTNTGSGNIALHGAANNSEIVQRGSGDVQLYGSTGVLNILKTGSGYFYGFDYSAGTAEVAQGSSGEVRVKVYQRLQGSLDGSGDIVYLGNPSISVARNGSGVLRRY